jgi:hypothetical protein
MNDDPIIPYEIALWRSRTVRCKRCNDTGWWVEIFPGGCSGGPCDCWAGIRARPIHRWTA